ncbi:MAG: hypothetical protein M3Y33_13660 [Actinomycetota bacterium]|nr:hypothetical protein [Actinomycetota bacterium]
MTGPAFTPPKWRKPAPLSYGHAIDSAGTVGSSLLALAAAAVVLTGSVQFTDNTRQFLWSPADVRSWWPEMTEGSELEARLPLRRAPDAAGLDPVPGRTRPGRPRTPSRSRAGGRRAASRSWEDCPHPP